MTSSKENITCAVHWQDIEEPDDSRYPGHSELMSIGSPLARRLGLRRIGIHHERLPPGRRTSFPHAESSEEEFVYVLEGEPDVWIDGHLHKLYPGMAVGFPAGTGVAHSFLNNADKEVRLLVIGEASKDENRIIYPLNPELKAERQDWWEDAPQNNLGPHDGLTEHWRSKMNIAPNGENSHLKEPGNKIKK